MPPSITPESLERSTSIESINSTFSEPRSMHFSNEAEMNKRPTMNETNFPKHSSHYRSESENDDDDGCGDIAIFERPTLYQTLQRLRWCCISGPNVSKKRVEPRARTQSESTASSSSRLVSPVPATPVYQWEVPPHMMYPNTPQGWYPPPGYPSPYYPPNAYYAWGYPGAQMSINAPIPQPPLGSVYPSPTGIFHDTTYGYNGYEPNIPIRKNTAPETYLNASPYDSGNESEASRRSNNSNLGRNSVRSKKGRVVKPPRVQRRSSAPVHSSPFPSSHKEASKEQPVAHPPLPPKQPSRKNVFSSRPRLPSEMSRTSVGTASSRHRRQAHETFEFSTSSLQEIAREGPIPVGPPPLNFIEVQPLQRTCSWSTWDDQTHNDDDDNSLLLSPDEDEVAGYISPVEGEAASPTRKNCPPPTDWMVQWAHDGKTTIEPPQSPASRTSRLSEPPPMPTKDNAKGPVYLPLSLDLDQEVLKTGAVLVFSGWAAASEGDSMRNKLGMAEDDELPIEHEDICYLQLVQEGNTYSLKIHRHSQETQVVVLTSSLQALSQEANGRAGRCVLLQDAWTRKVLWTILPVSLPSYFFREGKVVSARHFEMLKTAMVTPFYNATLGTPQEWSQEYCMRRYAPDAQHDAAMHVLFCMDAALSAARQP